MTTANNLTILIIAWLLPKWGFANDTPLLNVQDSSLLTSRRTDRLLTEFTAGVICSVAENGVSTAAETELHTINFYYALGTKNVTSVDALQTFELQQKLFHAVERSIAWCYEEPIGTFSAANDKTRRRMLRQTRRNLGILAVSVGPTVSNVGNCTSSENINTFMSETGADHCQMNEGSIRVLVHAGNTLNYMSSVLLDTLRTALNDDLVWKDWKAELKGISFLAYYGASLEEDDGGSAAAVAGSGAGVGLLLGIGIPIILLLLLLGFVKSGTRREQVTQRQFNHMMKSDFVLSGTGDAPGSFHQGLYHYMRDGTRYLSTNCEGCLETRRNSYFADDGLGTIMEGTVFQENMLVSASCTNLGKRTSNMDVHKCTSSTCQRCFPPANGGTRFIPALGEWQVFAEA
ncbi:hypothetical protein MPSEU_000513100 [Mayamaea pseudoterrestris]|nr:hypothetical protein MPSEU_000513100 [Mayamaea pseudoterrestris]